MGVRLLVTQKNNDHPWEVNCNAKQSKQKEDRSINRYRFVWYYTRGNLSVLICRKFVGVEQARGVSFIGLQRSSTNSSLQLERPRRVE